MKKKIIFLILSILVLIIFIGGGIIFYISQRDDKISLIEEKIVIEYGQSYNPSLNELINFTEFDFINTENVKIESNIENEDNKEYPAVGNYEINVYYKDKNLSQKVEVKDTTSPELSMKENIDIENGVDINTVNIKQYAKATDLSELKDYNIDLTNVDTNKAGEYVAKIFIEDIYGNKSEKEFKIVVPEKEEPVVEVKEENVVAESTTQSQPQTQTKTTEKKGNANNSNTNSTKTDSSDTANENKSENKNENKSANKEQQNNSNNEKKKQPVWCDEGGPKHWQGNGPNEHRLL